MRKRLQIGKLLKESADSLEQRSRFSAESSKKKTLSAYVDRRPVPQKEAKMVKKQENELKRMRVRLYRASSEPPLRIGDSAKTALGKMKKALDYPERMFVRITTIVNPNDDHSDIDIFFDDHLEKADMVYLSNKILFVLDQKTAIRLTGGTLECDHLGFYIDSVFFDRMSNLDDEELPKC